MPTQEKPKKKPIRKKTGLSDAQRRRILRQVHDEIANHYLCSYTIRVDEIDLNVTCFLHDRDVEPTLDTMRLAADALRALADKWDEAVVMVRAGHAQDEKPTVH